MISSIQSTPSRKRQISRVARASGGRSAREVGEQAGDLAATDRDGSGGPAQLATVWNPQAKTAARAAFEATHLPFAPAAWQRVEAALDGYGRDWTTMQLANALPGWQQDGRDVAFIIGGADGLDPQVKSRADVLLRVSSLMLPHGMVRVLLAEQLYRAWSITQNHPYHRA